MGCASRSSSSARSCAKEGSLSGSERKWLRRQDCSRSDPGAQAGPEGARRAGDARGGLFTGNKGCILCGQKGRILGGKGCLTEAPGRWLLSGSWRPRSNKAEAASNVLGNEVMIVSDPANLTIIHKNVPVARCIFRTWG